MMGENVEQILKNIEEELTPTSGVYGLISTRDGYIRYVGQSGKVQKRFSDHWVGKSSNPSIGYWMRQELWCGYDIDYIIIEKCHSSIRGSRETHWIERISNLLNDRKKGTQVAPTPDEDQLLNALQKDCVSYFTENWSGFVGIRYYPPTHTPEEYERIPFPSDTSFAWPTWEVRVFDPFGDSLYGNQRFDIFEDAVQVRQMFRNMYNKVQMERFGVSLPWPPDKVEEKNT